MSVEPPPSTTFIGRLLGRLERVPGIKGNLAQAIFLGLFFVASLSLYLIVLKIRGHDRFAYTEIAWDHWFPFFAWWTWIYLFPYIVGPILAASLRRPAFEWYIRRASIVVVVSIIIFCIIPTQTVRPPTDHLEEGLTKWMYINMVTIDDPPANAAPSLHVSLSCLLAWALVYDRPRWWWAALLGAIIVWLSTLYTKQHHLIDVFTGAALASIAAIGPPKRNLDEQLAK